MKWQFLTSLLGMWLLCGSVAALGKAKEKDGQVKKVKKTPAHMYEALAALGVPHPFELSVGMRLDERRRVSAHAGLFERRFRGGKGFKSLDGSMKHIEARYLSFIQERPFWAVSVGYQELSIAGSRAIPIATDAGELKIDTDARIVVQALYWTPQIGLSTRGSNGFIYNFVAGVQIPFLVNAKFSSRFTDDSFIDESIKSTDDYAALQNDIEKLGERYGKLALPVIKLFELGMSF